MRVISVVGYDRAEQANSSNRDVSRGEAGAAEELRVL